MQLQPFLRLVNGEYSWGELKAYYLARYATRMQLWRPEVIHAVLSYPTDDEYKNAVEVLRQTLQRWTVQWIAHPPTRKDWDWTVYAEQNAESLRNFHDMVRELPKEAVLGLFVPGQSSQTSSSEPAGPGRRIQRVTKNLLPSGALSGKFWSLEDYVNEILASLRFDDPHSMSKAIAVGLFRTLLQSGIRVGRCQILECNRYFLDLSGVTKFCSRKHAQAAVNHRRKQKRDAVISKILLAIKEYEERGSREEDWRTFVAKRARVTQYLLTLLANEKVIAGPSHMVAQRAR